MGLYFPRGFSQTQYLRTTNKVPNQSLEVVKNNQSIVHLERNWNLLRAKESFLKYYDITTLTNFLFYMDFLFSLKKISVFEGYFV